MDTNDQPAPLIVESFICRCKTEIRFHVLEADLNEDQKHALTTNNILVVSKGATITCPNCQTEITIK